MPCQNCFGCHLPDTDILEDDTTTTQHSGAATGAHMYLYLCGGLLLPCSGLNSADYCEKCTPGTYLVDSIGLSLRH